MAQTDFWSSQERMIVSDFELSFILASGTISEGDMLKYSHSGTAVHSTKWTALADGAVVMEAATSGLGTALAVAIKAATTGVTFPAMFQGVQKMTICGSAGDTNHKLFAGSLVINSASATKIVSTTKGWAACATGETVLIKCTSHILGMAMQAGNGADEILVLVGRSI